MIRKPSFALSSILLGSIIALGALACSNDHTSMDDDAGIVVPDSARPPDAVFYDAGPVSGNVGAACTADTDCVAPATNCIPDDGDLFPGGYCTAMCDPSMAESCPTGTQCQDFGGGQTLCVLSCDSSMMTRQCNGRMGYGCTTNPQLSDVCLGGCVDATDCGGTLMCDPMGGQLGSGACFTPGAAVGIACTMDTQCASGGFCDPEDGGGWPSGSCLGTGCDLTMAASCDGDAQCIPLTGGFGGPPQGVCIDGCVSATDCRAGYVCTTSSVYPDRHYCGPGCTSNAQCTGGRVCNVGLGTCGDAFTGTLGGACSRRDPTTCAGGTCLSERSYGFPASYCSYTGCTATQACPSSGVCLARPGAAGICLRACTMDSQCATAGYGCRHSDPADTTSAMACMPACTGNAQCTSMGDVCNVGTGLCTPAFTATSSGTACTSDTACVGGRCMTEAGFGYSGGECVYPGCSITTGVTGATCPANTACVDDHVGSADLGICAPTCTVGGTTCRAGYACTALTGSTTNGTCQPMCTSSSCAAGRTCDTGTGLCH